VTQTHTKIVNQNKQYFLNPKTGAAVAKFCNSPKAETAIRKEKQLSKGICHVFNFSFLHNQSMIFNSHETLNILKLET